MEDLIKRDDAISKTFCSSIDGVPRMVVLLDDIKAIPSADRPVGEWIPMTVSSGRDSWKCSVCGRRARGKTKNLPYCHCGARMKGADDEESV